MDTKCIPEGQLSASEHRLGSRDRGDNNRYSPIHRQTWISGGSIKRRGCDSSGQVDTPFRIDGRAMLLTRSNLNNLFAIQLFDVDYPS